jgi:hypothetical protein
MTSRRSKMDAIDTLFGAISASKNERSLKILTKGWELILENKIDSGINKTIRQ